MFYISAVTADRKYSVMDTEDLVEEVVTLDTLDELIQKGIEINGYRENGKSYALSLIDGHLVPHFKYVAGVDIPDYITTSVKAVGKSSKWMYHLSDTGDAIERGVTLKEEIKTSGLISAYYTGTSANSQAKSMLGVRDSRGTSYYDDETVMIDALASPEFVHNRAMLLALIKESNARLMDDEATIIEVTEEGLFRLLDLQLRAEAQGTTTAAAKYGYRVHGSLFVFLLKTARILRKYACKSERSTSASSIKFISMRSGLDSDFNTYYTKEPIPELVLIQKYFLRVFMFHIRRNLLASKDSDDLADISPKTFLHCPMRVDVPRTYTDNYCYSCNTTLNVHFEKDDCFVDVAQPTGKVVADSLMTLVNNPTKYNEVKEKDGYFYVNTLEGLVAIDMASYRAFYGFEDNSRIKKYKLRQMLSGAGGLVEVHENGVCSKCYTAKNGDCTIPAMATELSKGALGFDGTDVKDELYRGEYSVFLTIPKSLTKLHKEFLLHSYSKRYTVYIKGEISSPELAKQLLPVILKLTNHCVFDVRDKDSLVNLLYGCISNDCNLWSWQEVRFSRDGSEEVNSKVVTTCKAVLYDATGGNANANKNLRYYKSKLRYATDETNALLDNDVITRAINLFLRLDLKNFKFLNTAPKLSIRSKVSNSIFDSGRYAVRLTTWKKYSEKVSLLTHSTSQFGYYLRDDQLAKIDSYCYTALQRFAGVAGALSKVAPSRYSEDKEVISKANQALEDWYNSL